MKKILSGRKLTLAVIIATLATLICVAALAAAATLSYPFTTVTTDQVNLRKKASSTATILVRVPQGASVNVTGASGSYYKVTYKDRTGYVLKKYVSTDPESVTTPAPTPVATTDKYPYDTTANAKVNLRAEKSRTAKILKTIPAGATVTVKSITGTYAVVLYKGVEGYVKHEYLNLKTLVTPTPKPTAVPTTNPTGLADAYTVLEKGSTGDAVVALQSALRELGFLTGTADGKYGDATARAVSALQAANGYPETGVADANLQAMIYSGKPKGADGKATQVKTLAPVDGATIRLNSTGPLVSKVQTRLKELGFYSGEITGKYNSATMSAVKKFQKKQGMKVDGVCGADTQKKLFSSKAISANATPTPKPTPKPTAVPTYERPSAEVRNGSSGANALMVQTRLKELGYYNGKLDGKFGSGSVKSLKDFQTCNGLTADGKAGEATYDILFSYKAVSYKEAHATPTPTPKATKTPKPGAETTIAAPAEDTYAAALDKDNCVTVKKGSKGTAVTAVKQQLTTLGYYTADNSATCSDADTAAIKAFQKTNGIKADGVAGYATQSVLFSGAALSATGEKTEGGSYSTLRKGMSGAEVTRLQERLIALGYMEGPADGNYGTKTAEAVYTFQKTNNLSRDSIAGPGTQELLYSASALPAAPKATATPKPETTSLHKGDSSDAVKAMQQRLIDLGYLSGKADGKFGVQTYRALQAFQKANRLKADGVAGAQTLAALNGTDAVGNQSAAQPTATPKPANSTGTVVVPEASKVRYANWYSEVKSRCKSYPYATVYDFSTGISWQVHMFSLGAHADAEPLTSKDTANLKKAFGGNTWNPKAVWVVFGDGRIYMASTHSMPHAPQHRTDNNFNGHLCIHFPRTDAQVAAIGTYATSHQKTIDAGWAVTQGMK